MSPRQQVRWGYLGVIVTLVAVVMTSTSGHQSPMLMVMFASMGMLNVINIAQATDRSFLHRHKALIAVVFSGVVLPLIVLIASRTSSLSDWPFQGVPQLVLVTVEILVVGGAAVFGFLRSTRPVLDVGSAVSDLLTIERKDDA